MRNLALAALVLAACSSDRAPEPLGRTRAPILNGRASGDDEDAAIYLETKSAAATLRCSGRIIAPGLVLTARHCLLSRTRPTLACTAEGSPVDITDDTDLTPRPANEITVYVGHERSSLRPVAVREVMTELEISLCRSDLALVVLAEKGLDVRAPIRRAPVAIGEALAVSGWGYTSDALDKLPDQRMTLDRVAISDVGPGRIPGGNFAVAGNSVCLGDSGAVALVDGAVVGNYSHLDGGIVCSLPYVQNVFTGIAGHERLLEHAYAAIGEEPWYAGERPPWLAAAGAACAKDDDCRSAVCDPIAARCASPCGDAGLGCPAGQECRGDACVVPAVVPADAGAAPTAAAPAATDGGSCRMQPLGSTRASGAILLFLVVVVAAVRRRVTGAPPSRCRRSSRSPS